MSERILSFLAVALVLGLIFQTILKDQAFLMVNRLSEMDKKIAVMDKKVGALETFAIQLSQGIQAAKADKPAEDKKR